MTIEQETTLASIDSARVVNEKSPYQFDVAFTDVNGDPSVPTTVDVTIHDVDSATVIRASTPETPASTITIKILPNENRILNTVGADEEREVTITTNAGNASFENNQSVRYRVVNLRYVTGVV